MPQPVKFLQISVTVFKVLAWLALGFQVVTGLILIVVGGEPVFFGGIELPARAVGFLGFLTAAMHFFALWLMSCLIQVVLEIRQKLPG